jgi:methionyl-tRNA synthetase
VGSRPIRDAILEYDEKMKDPHTTPGVAVPTCCEAGTQLRLGYLNYYTEDKDFFLKTKPEWLVRLWDVHYETDRAHAIQFCPFCGKPLPKIRLKVKIPKRVMTMTDGGYYCDTCGKRLMECNCLPPEVMWEIDKTEKGQDNE